MLWSIRNTTIWVRRPVFFGEAVPEFERAAGIVPGADLMIVVGTSLAVYPAASLVHCLRRGGRPAAGAAGSAPGFLGRGLGLGSAAGAAVSAAAENGLHRPDPVSYTHLDVYKRQAPYPDCSIPD